MPTAWTKKDEKQYQAIRRQLIEEGRNEKRAEEIAARTVNKQRRKEGRTPNKTTMGTGNPSTKLEKRTKQELYNRAKQLGIAGRSRMNKQELIKAVRRAS